MWRGVGGGGCCGRAGNINGRRASEWTLMGTVPAGWQRKLVCVCALKCVNVCVGDKPGERDV